MTTTQKKEMLDWIYRNSTKDQFGFTELTEIRGKFPYYTNDEFKEIILKDEYLDVINNGGGLKISQKGYEFITS